MPEVNGLNPDSSQTQNIPNWDYYGKLRMLPLWRAVALICNLRPDQELLCDPDPLLMNTKYATLSFRKFKNPRLQQFLVIALNHLGSAHSFLVLKEFEKFSAMHSLVDLPSFGRWAENLGFELPEEFPTSFDNIEAHKSHALLGVDLNAPYISENLRKLILIAKEQYDSEAPPKQDAVAVVIDERLGYSHRPADKPSSVATSLAGVIRPDHFKENDKRSSKRRSS